MWCSLLFTFALLALCPLGKQVKVNLQWAICDADPQTVLRKLGEDGTREPYKKTPITYYDTDPPSYSWGGLMFRTKTRRDEELSAVKVHFDPRTFLCVWDRYGNNTSFACQIQSLLDGRRKLWTDEQIRFAERFQRVHWTDLVGFGPNPNPKWRLNISDHEGVFDDVQAETFHLMELEVKVLRYEADEVYGDISKYLREHNISLCYEQEPRTLRLFRSMGYNRSHKSLIKQYE
ncbi:uncharacterized protein TRIVIDRAFT_29068 [Trichoderma virens Gv29-8]|uniref:CYTH domain-containing protein n=1 Tax=Hypocrea virens (strain Gv29-8 / FGSC 10586) TaxID=413071 RepID=G9MSM1_HYPVG|nr:uncharacterized protein TRIVIDRAFT_29068 [Trichoderma virens Gv29-8]EHK23024.1 hypothetical protein TRIVIDRAFT_29068 [Trichoderma virens Gv29-8]